MNKIIPSLFSILSLLLTACQDDDLAQGINSLEGSWQVTAAKSFYEIAQPDGRLQRSRVDEEGNLGRFEFAEDMVSYQFNRNDTLYQGRERWHLENTRENQGFFKVNRFTLLIDGTFTFKCEFEDQTKNAEQNAKNITLRTKLEEKIDAVSFEMSLNKE